MKNELKIIVTTSNKYHHLLKVFIFLFNKNWSSNQQVEIVGYDKPDFQLPSNFSFHSLGEQIGDAHNFTTDLKPYFEKQDKWFIWFFEDSWVKKVNFTQLETLKSLMYIENVGRINLTYASRIQDHIIFGNVDEIEILENTQTALYRLCTQPSIWNRDFLLQYMKPNLTPWEFETQESFNDNWRILGSGDSVVEHNEGVTKHDIYDYDLHGIEEDQIEEMKQLKLI